MAHLVYKPNSILPMDITWQLPVDVAQHLDKAGIPHLLWGAAAMKLLGIETEDMRVEFIVPDDLLDKAKQTLLDAEFIQGGQDAEVCHVGVCMLGSFETTHVHVPEKEYRKGTRNELFGVILHPKSSLVWALPDFPGVLSPDDENYMLSTNYRVTKTALPFFKSSHAPYSFTILTPHAHLNALIRLRLRDWNHPNQLYMEWTTGILEFKRTLFKQGVLGTDDVEHIFRWAFYILHEAPRDPASYRRLGDYVPEDQRVALELIRNKLLEKGELTAPPELADPELM